jgi:predicted TIM-barrel fold metal-dependent hydrolase
MNAIVDAHLHVWEAESLRYPWQPLRNMRPAEAAPAEMLLDVMQQAGVGQAIIVQPSNYGYDHTYVAGCLHRFPGRFGGVALFDFRAPAAAERLAGLRAQGFAGVRLYFYHEDDLSWVGPQIDEAMAVIADLGMIVTVFGPWSEMARVDELARRHAKVRFVIDHLGHPDVTQPLTWQPILRLAERPLVHIKLSDLPHLSRQGYPFRDVFPFVAEAFSAFGAQRMMWASNFPHILRQGGYTAALALVGAALPQANDDDVRWITGGVASRLWQLGG